MNIVDLYSSDLSALVTVYLCVGYQPDCAVG